MSGPSCEHTGGGVQRSNERDVKSVVAKARTRVAGNLARALDGSTTSHHDALATSAATADRHVGSHVSSEALKTIRVIFHHDSSLVVPITTNFPSVEKDVDVVKSLVRSKVKLLKEGVELRLLHVFQSKI
ncbi:unnamed protein product [Brassica napus]|uniref:(rape) hypothetical protein n=1 Tax=Brassica napus TaxID=3708 RepID=A0A816KSI9_BRANA|nr:unnamed protein product [Brassica napus]